MAENAGDVIKDAYFELLEASDEAPIEASEMATGLRYLNRLMSRLAAQGYDLGYTEVTNPSDIITVPAGAMDGIVSNLAVSLSAQFPQSGISQGLQSKAILGMTAIRRLSTEVIPSNYPSTLPIGSGSQCSGSNSRFYGAPEDPIINEAGDYIAEE